MLWRKRPAALSICTVAISAVFQQTMCVFKVTDGAILLRVHLTFISDDYNDKTLF